MRPRTLFSALLVPALALSFALAGGLAALAESDWPQWRGPQRDNISPDTGLLTEWKAEGPPLAWKATGLGSGFSGVSIAGKHIYTMGDFDGKQHVICLNRENGEQIWATPIGNEWEPRGYSGPRCTPTVDGDRVYAVGAHGDLACLEADTGKVVWKHNFKADFGGRMHSGWGFSESPLVDGDLLICTPGAQDAMLAALNKQTGETVWKTAAPDLGENGGDGAAYSSIVISNAAGVKQYVQLVGRGLVGVDAATGKLLWSYNQIANRTANIPTPLIHEDYVFASTGYGTGACLLKIEATDEGLEAREQYFLNAKEFQNHHGGMVMLGDYIYAGHGHNAGAPTCLEWKTGKQVWRQGRGPGSGSAALGYADGHLYFRYQNGKMALVKATPEGYQLQGTFEIPDVERPSWPHPVIIDGKLYLREQDALYCYDVSK